MLHSVRSRLGIAAALALLGTPALASDNDGHVIVVAADAPPAEQHAAQELREALVQATGARPEIVASAPAGRSAIAIGKASGLKTDGLGDEDFTIRVADGQVAIVGGSPRGTLYGVYTFLEDQYGVRYLASDCVSIPRADPAKTIPNGERTFRPRFSWRYSYYGANHHDPQLAARLRNNAAVNSAELGGHTAWSLISHTVSNWIPVAKLGKDHPEFFSLVNGKRRADMTEDHFGNGGTQPCFTNPEVKKRIIDGVLAQLEKNNQTDGVISISQNDNMQYCRCPECAAIDEREGSHMGSLLALLNEAGAAVAKVRPGVCVGTLAYQHTRKPPKTMKPGPNVAIQLCSIEACQVDPLDDPACSLNQSFCSDLDGWCKISDKVYVWNYNVDFSSYNLPCPNLEIIGANVKYLARNGVRGVFMQAAGDARNSELCDLRNYLISRMIWDPSLDSAAVTNEFIDRYYGKAGDDVRAYIRLICETPRKKGVHRLCFGAAGDYGFDDAVGREALALLESGMAKAESPVVRDRVEKLTIGPRTILLEQPFARWVASHRHAITNGQYQEASAQPFAGKEAEIRELFRLYDKHGVSHYAEGLAIAPLRKALPASLLEGGK